MEEFYKTIYEKKWILYLLLGVFFCFFILTQIMLSHRLVQDYDEGVYLTTFLLIDKGHTMYRDIFFSQPPGFLLSVYPGFYLLGKTLVAARMTVAFWSLIGLFAIVWISVELKKPWMSIFALGVLFLNPLYTNYVSVFQSDMIPNVFCLLSLATLLRFVHTKNMWWIAFSSFFFTFAFLTKFNFFLILPILSLFFYEYKKNNSLKELRMYMGIFFSVFIIITFGVSYYFGLEAVITNTIVLRTLATKVHGDSLFRIASTSYSFIITCTLTILLLITNRKRFSFMVILFLLWYGSVLISFIFYKPLFPHHMSTLVIPIILLFSYLVTLFLDNYKKIYIPLVLVVFILSSTQYFFNTIGTPTSSVITLEQQRIVRDIINNSVATDTILTDDEILYGESQRFPDPRLSDVSFVRIQSGNLSPELFEEIVSENQPKLILPRTGRIESIEGFKEVLEDYHILVRYRDSVIYERNSE